MSIIRGNFEYNIYKVSEVSIESLICLCWANSYIWWKWLIVFGIFLAILVSLGLFMYHRKEKDS